MRRTRGWLAGLVALLALAAIPGASAMAQGGEATVTVVHGIPGAPVDVYANGDVLLEDFQPETITDPQQLPAGNYEIEIREAGAAPDSQPLISGEAEVGAGDNASLVAHLDARGQPTLTPYVNDASSAAAGEARVAVRHDAAAPAVDVLAGGDPIIEGLQNPDEETVNAPAGSVEVAVAAAGDTNPVIGPQALELASGGSYAVYAIGSLDDDTLGLLVQDLGAGAAAPGAIPGGNSPVEAGGADGAILALAIGGAIVAVFSAFALRRRLGS